MNKRVTTFARAAAGVLALAAAAAAAAAPVTVTSFQARTTLGDIAGLPTSQTDLPTSANSGIQSFGHSVAGNSSNLRVDAQGTGTGALFDFDFDLVRTSSISSYASTWVNLWFTVGASDTLYTLSGFFGAQGLGVAHLDFRFTDMGTGSRLLLDISESQGTANETFLLGASGDGDYLNSTYGALSGTLLAGHTYLFSFDGQIRNSWPSLGATASGCVSLALGDAQLDTECGIAAETAAAAASTSAQTVPEPGSLALAGLALAGLASARRRARA